MDSSTSPADCAGAKWYQAIISECLGGKLDYIIVMHWLFVACVNATCACADTPNSGAHVPSSHRMGKSASCFRIPAFTSIRNCVLCWRPYVDPSQWSTAVQ